MIRKIKIYRIIGLLVTMFFSISTFGQIDTIRNENGSITEIGQTLGGLKHGKWTTYFSNGTLESERLYDMGKRVGKWTWYHDNGVLCSKEKYKNDKFIKGKFWDKKGNRSDIYEIMIKPEYPGGMDAFRQMVAANLQYPEEAQINGISGRVFIQFNINKEGDLVDAKIVKGVNPHLDREAMRVIKLSEKWKPGTFHGEKVKVSYTFPVVFILQ